MTVEVALAHLVMSMGVGSNMSDSATLELISSISGQLFVLVALSLILSVGLSGGAMVAFRGLTLSNAVSPYQSLLSGIKKFFPL